MNKPAVIVVGYRKEKTENMLKSVLKYPAGCDYDLFVVVNYGEDELNEDTDQEVEDVGRQMQLTVLCEDLKKKGKVTDVFSRENKGQDWAAYRHGYNRVKSSDYGFYLFLGDKVLVEQANWLKEFQDAYAASSDVWALSPQLGVYYTEHESGLEVFHGFFPRGSMWSARSECLRNLDWPEAKTRQDCIDMEKSLLCNHTWANGKKVGAVDITCIKDTKDNSNNKRQNMFATASSWAFATSGAMTSTPFMSVNKVVRTDEDFTIKPTRRP